MAFHFSRGYLRRTRRGHTSLTALSQDVKRRKRASDRSEIKHRLRLEQVRQTDRRALHTLSSPPVNSTRPPAPPDDEDRQQETERQNGSTLLYGAFDHILA